MAVEDADLQLDFSSNNHAFNIHSVEYLSKAGMFSTDFKNVFSKSGSQFICMLRN